MVKEHLDYHEKEKPEERSPFNYAEGSSPLNSYIQEFLPESKAAQVLGEIDKQINLLKTKKNKSK